MAKALSKITDRSQSTSLFRAIQPDKRITAYTCGLLLTGALSSAGLLVSSQSALAADFTHAQHVFVPPTSIPRHFDSESLNYGNATGDGPDLYPSSGTSSNGASVKTTTQNGKSFNKTFYDSRAAQSKTSPSVGSGANADASPAMNAFVNQARAKAQSLVKQGKLTAAEDMLQTDLKAAPKSQGLQTELATVRVARARVALKSGDTAGAAQHAEAALLAQPNNAAAKQILAQTESHASATANSITEHLSRARTLTGQARYTEAKQEIQAALKIKDTADVHTSLGDLAFKQGNNELARTEYANALQIDPESGNALRQNGIFKLHQEDVVGANKDLSRALIINSKDKEAASALQKIWQGQIAKNPQSSNAHLGLARAYQLSDELPQAQAEYKEVVRLDPQHPSIPAARKSFKLALAKQESVKCLQAAKTLEDAGDLTEAHQKAIEAVNISPTSVSARLYQGAISEKLKLYAEAHEAYMTALRYDPKNAIAARHLRALQGTANLAEATAAKAPSAPNVPPGMYVFRGWQYGHPLATTPPPDAGTASYSASAQSADSSGNAATAYGAAQNASYAAGAASSSPMAALAAGPALALPGGPTTAQLADPSAPMPLQGLPPATASTTNHVNAFSSFLGSLRDLTVNQKQQSQQAESSMSSYLNPGGSSSSGLGSSSLAGLGIGTGAGAPINATGAGTSASLPGSVDTSIAPVSTPSASSISSILAQAKAAVSRAGGTPTQTSNASSYSLSAGSGSSTVTAAVTPPDSTAPAAAAAAGGGADSGQSISGAAWDAAPAWVRKKFPNMTQADFTALAGKVKGSMKTRLQALAAQQKAASLGKGTPPTADDALAGLLPAGMTASQLGTALSAAAAPAAASATSVLANLMPPATTAKTAENDLAEQEMIARAGQDSPTTPPPDVVPAEAVTQTTVVLKSQTGGTGAASAVTTPNGVTAITTAPTPAIAALTALSAAGVGVSAAGSGQPSATTINSGLQPQAPTLAMVPTDNSLRPAIGRTELQPAPSSTTPDASKDDSNNDNSNASVVLELQGYNPTSSGIKLKVALKNSRTKSLALPESARAVIHMPGQADREARITFSSREVAPGGVAQGTIKVPGHDLNPAADLVLPNFLPTAFADRDVHLTVPISSLMK